MIPTKPKVIVVMIQKPIELSSPSEEVLIQPTILMILTTSKTHTIDVVVVEYMEVSMTLI